MIEAFMQQILNKFAPGTTTGIIVQDGATGTPNNVILVDGNANTFGAWVELDASASANGWLCIICASAITEVNNKVCLEIGTGAAASEVTKARFSFNITKANWPLTLPKVIRVASGTRIAARCSSSTGGSSNLLNCGISMYQNLET